MTEPMERALLLEAQQGDVNAYEDLQLMLQPAIHRFVQRMLTDPMLTEDIVQEVFIKFYQNIGKIDPPENMKAYLYRIARNRCYDELRREGRYESMSLDEEPVELYVSFTQSHTQQQPDDATYWLLLSIEVREAVDQLPESQRRALILYSDEGMSYPEIAQIEGISLGTVKSRIYYAKKNLRQYLNPDTLDAILSEFQSTVKQPPPADKKGEKPNEPQKIVCPDSA